jgi:hypothetical protein
MLTGDLGVILDYRGWKPINRREAVVAFHGHAHAGNLEGTICRGVEVFNVARTILIKAEVNPYFYVLEYRL